MARGCKGYSFFQNKKSSIVLENLRCFLKQNQEELKKGILNNSKFLNSKCFQLKYFFLDYKWGPIAILNVVYKIILPLFAMYRKPISSRLHYKFLPHENYRDWKLQSPCRENLHYQWKRPVRIAKKPCDNYRSFNHHGNSPQFLQPFSIDSADLPCRDPAIPNPGSFHGVKICSVSETPLLVLLEQNIFCTRGAYNVNQH